IARYEYTIQDQQSYLFSQVKVGEKSSFDQIFLALESRIHAIVTFLALLELLSLQRMKLIQGEGTNNFWLTVPEDMDDLPDVEHDDDLSPLNSESDDRGFQEEE
ncbi:MAG: hypothetical protein KDC80_19050, partial [Saprospiraceae bacterium]|nr:hypothetical protein [Saprospiraceae bacterium]